MDARWERYCCIQLYWSCIHVWGKRAKALTKLSKGSLSAL